MEIKKVLETVFIKEYNTTAHILENDIYVCLFNNVFQNRQECFKELDEYCKGLVQSTLGHRYLIKNREKSGGRDCIIQYDKIFDELEKYAENKFSEFKKTNHLNSFKFKWYTTENEEGKKYRP